MRFRIVPSTIVESRDYTECFYIIISWLPRGLQPRGRHGGTMTASVWPNTNSRPHDRVAAFCAQYGLQLPILLAPMAGACPASLSIAVANAGGMGAMGALMTKPSGIRAWVNEFRSGSSGPFQLNTWIPDPKPERDAQAEARLRAFLAAWGPEVSATAGDAVPPDFR